MINKIKNYYFSCNFNSVKTMLLLFGLSLVTCLMVMVSLSSDLSKYLHEKGYENFDEKDTVVTNLHYEEYTKINNVKNVIVSPYSIEEKLIEEEDKFYRYYNVSTTLSFEKTGRLISPNSSYVIPNFSKANLIYGRFFNGKEVENEVNVTVLNYLGALSFFGKTDVIGEYIFFDETPYKVIGVLEKTYIEKIEYQNFLFTQKNKSELGKTDVFHPSVVIYTPLQTLSKDSFDYVSIVSNHPDVLNDILRNNLDINAENIFNRTDVDIELENYRQVMSIYSLEYPLLIVSGLLIMYIMFSNIRSRTVEIAIRRTIGAKKSDVIIQFTLTGIIFSILAFFIGLFLGVNIFLLIINIQIREYLFNIIINPITVIRLFLSTMLVTTVFSVFPSYCASNINISDTLKIG